MPAPTFFFDRWNIRPFAFLCLAAGGFVLSLAVHLLAFAGIHFPGEDFAMLLHGGVFVVWFPAIITLRQSAPAVPRGDLWKLIAKAPLWMRIAVGVLMVYAMVNFFISVP